VVGSGPLATLIVQPAMLASLQLLSISLAFGSPTVVTRSAAMLKMLKIDVPKTPPVRELFTGIRLHFARARGSDLALRVPVPPE
jgi:hypothetical protein